VVVKSCAIPPVRTLVQLAADGVLDARFEPWSHDAPFPIEVVDGDALERVRDALLGGPAVAPPLALAAAALASSGSRQRSPRPRRKPEP